MRPPVLSRALLALVLTLCVSASAGRAETLRVYGPGGPAPAMKEAATLFSAQTGHDVQVTAGPADRWMRQAQADADLIFSGSEHMMTAFIGAHGGVVEDSVVPLFMRPSALLVRKGNPRKITGVRSLLAPGMKVMVVQGAGQVGMWEDVLGRLRNIKDLRLFRANIAFRAPNSGVARERWRQDTRLDAWLIWNHWQIDNAELADLVPVEPELTVYRDTAIGLTRRGAPKATARAFLAFLQSPEAATIFAAHGWQRSF